MRVSEEGVALTSRNQGVRKCIAEAVIELMNYKRLEELTVTEIVKRANVSRMTFYKYYKTKEEVLDDYMYEMVNDYIADAAKHPEMGRFYEYQHICYSFHFFKTYSDQIKCLIKADFYGIIIGALNSYMDLYVLPTMKWSRYDLYYYAGALCNVYVKWVMSNMQETPEEMAAIVYKQFACLSQMIKSKEE